MSRRRHGDRRMRLFASLLLLTACGVPKPQPKPPPPYHPPPVYYPLVEVEEEMRTIDARNGWTLEVCASAIEKAEHTRPDAPGFEDYLRGVVADRCGDRERAREHLRRAIRVERKTVMATSAKLWLILDELEHHGDEALPKFVPMLQQSIADASFKHAPALLELSRLQRRLARHSNEPALQEEALRNIRRAIAVDPYLVSARVELVSFLLEEAGMRRERISGTHDVPRAVDQRLPGVLTEAWHAARHGVKRFPERAAMHHALGRVALARGLVGAATTSFGQAVALSPDTPAWAVSYGSVLLMQRRFTEAADVYRRARGTHPTHYELRVGFSVALRGEARPEGLVEAQKTIEAAVAEAPGRAPAHYEAGLVALATHRRDDAQRHLRRFVQLSANAAALRAARNRAIELLERPQ